MTSVYHSQRTRTNQPPPPLLVAAASGSFTLLAFLSLIQAWLTTDPRWLAVTIGSAVALLMLLDRLAKIDQWISMPPARVDQPKPTNDQPLIQPEIQTTSESSTTIRYGKMKLNRDQWQLLAKAIQTNGDRLTRSIIPAGLFSNLNARYPTIVNEFTRLGWIDDNQQLTHQGKEWFERFLPLPYNLINREPGGDRTTTTTSGDDTAAAAENWLNQRRRGNHE